MRYTDFKLVEAGEVYVIGDSHARAMGGSNNLASDGARLSAIASQAQRVPNGSTVYMTGGHNDVASGTSPQSIASSVRSIIASLQTKDCVVNYILFPEGSSNTNQENMAPTRQAIQNAVDVANDLDGCTMQNDGIHCSLGSYRGLVRATSSGGSRSVSASRRNDSNPFEHLDPNMQGGLNDPGRPREAIRELQAWLSSKGYPAGEADGIYGPNTARAVRQFQRDVGATVDGDAGRETIGYMIRIENGEVELTRTQTGTDPDAGDAPDIADAPSSNEMLQLLDYYANKYRINSRFVRAIARKESNFNVRAVGDRGLRHQAYGIMQVRKPAMDDVNDTFGTNYTEEDLMNFDPNAIAEVGVGYLAVARDRYGADGYAEMAAMYNGGPAGPRNSQAIRYARDVMRMVGRS